MKVGVPSLGLVGQILLRRIIILSLQYIAFTCNPSAHYLNRFHGYGIEKIQHMSYSASTLLLITPTATVCLISRTANRPRGGNSVNASTHNGFVGSRFTMQASPVLTNLGLSSRKKKKKKKKK